MRQASFLVKGENGAVADISLVRLGAAAGNVLDNANRWLEQLGQPPITAEELAEITQRLTTPIGEVTIVDLAGLPKDADPPRAFLSLQTWVDQPTELADPAQMHLQ